MAEFLTSDTIRWIAPFTIGEGTKEMLKVGPLTLTARCTIDETIGGVANQDQADIIISTTQAKSAFDGDDLLGSLDPGDNIETRQFVNTTPSASGTPRFEASSDGLAIGGDGVVYIKGSYLFAGVTWPASRASAGSADTSSSRHLSRPEVSAIKGRCACAAPLAVRPGRRRPTGSRRTTRPCGTEACTTSSMLSPSRRPSASLSAASRAGAEIPYEVAESPGARSVLYRYKPALGRIRARPLPGTASDARVSEIADALSRIEGVSGYLRVMGTSYVPAAERDRAEAAMERFLDRVWEESSTFELEGGRFERAYRELESVIYEDTAVNTVLAPLLGVTMERSAGSSGPGYRWCGAICARRRPEAVWGSGRQDDDPNMLAVLTVESRPSEPPPLTEARMAFRKLVTALRLLKSGGAALSSVAWWRTDDGPWQEVPLGTSGRCAAVPTCSSRPSAPSWPSCSSLARSRPALGGALPWALARFELGCEQPVALDGLSDHLLALRALLDRGDPSPEGLARRLGRSAPSRPTAGLSRAASSRRSGWSGW